MSSDTDPAPVCYRFGPFVFDRIRRVLWRDGTIVPVPSKALELLLLLVDQRHRVVSKDELLEIVWAGTVVEENTLTRHISTLRRALGDDLRQHRFLLTVIGQGYQFVADIDELSQRPLGLEIDYSAIAAAARTESEGAAPEAPNEILKGVPEIIPSRDQRPAAATTRHPNLVVRPGLLVVLICVIAGAWIVLTVLHRASARQDGPFAVRQLTFLGGLQRYPAWSPDGRSVVFTSDRSGSSDLWVQRIGNPTPIQLTSGTGPDSMPDWSPDGLSVVFRSESDGGGLFVIAAAGGVARQIAPSGYWPQWSPDGKAVLFSSTQYAGGASKYFLVDGRGGGLLTPLRPDVLTDIRMLQVSWRPGTPDVSYWGFRDDSQVFCTMSVEAGRPPSCATIDPRVSETITKARVMLRRFRWAPSGHFLYFEGSSGEARSLWRVRLDAQTLEWKAIDRLTTGTTADVDLTVSRDGASVAFAARSVLNQLWTFSFDPVSGVITGKGRPVTSGAAGELDVQVTRDGSKLAYRAIRAGRNELWERDTRTGRERLLIADTETDRTAPVWSPDGDALAYVRRSVNGSAQEGAQVVILPTDTLSERVIYQSSTLNMAPIDWSSDGRALIGLCGHPGGLRATCRLDLSVKGNAPSVQILATDTTRNLFQQRLSPDGRWIAFIAVDATDAGASTIYVMPAAGGSWQAITEGQRYDDKPRWSPDGRTVFFVSDREGVLNVWGRHFDPVAGTPVGSAFRVTSFSTADTMIATNRVRMIFALTGGELYLPVEQTKAELWTLDGLEH